MSTSGIHAKVQEVKDQTRIERIGAHSHIRGKALLTRYLREIEIKRLNSNKITNRSGS